MRYSFGLLTGSSLALLLFVLLAWLVAPPQAPKPLKEMTLSLAEISDVPAEPPITKTASLSPPPPAVAPPAPAPNTESTIMLPDPELPPLEEPAVELDAPLPELTETPPEPVPKPEPKPLPKLQPKPQPNPAPSAKASTELVAESAPASSREPVDVGSSAQPTRRVLPQYPSRAQRRGLEGHVVVQFLIHADGSVDTGSIKVLEARPQKVFEQVARQAIADWRFEPARGLRRARQRLEFQLK
ncbi:MAG: TonB family protein [Marinobacter sp.]|uniref:TonB family protein n=1 Tax=Marinobacter sp. TaxID=50741 RepID=UPI003F9705AA